MLTQDPIGLAGGVNLYAYAGNNPTTFSDPFGLKAVCPPCLEEGAEYLEEEGPAAAEAVAAFGEQVVEADEQAVEQVVQKGSQLARNLQNSGVVRGAQEAAHHIVAQGAARAAQAREVLSEFGVKINSAVNGVFLPVKEGVGQAMNHATLHTKDYYAAVNEMVKQAESAEHLGEILDVIRQKLLDGTMTR